MKRRQSLITWHCPYCSIWLLYNCACVVAYMRFRVLLLSMYVSSHSWISEWSRSVSTYAWILQQNENTMRLRRCNWNNEMCPTGALSCALWPWFWSRNIETRARPILVHIPKTYRRVRNEVARSGRLEAKAWIEKYEDNSQSHTLKLKCHRNPDIFRVFQNARAYQVAAIFPTIDLWVLRRRDAQTDATMSSTCSASVGPTDKIILLAYNDETALRCVHYCCGSQRAAHGACADWVQMAGVCLLLQRQLECLTTEQQSGPTISILYRSDIHLLFAVHR